MTTRREKVGFHPDSPLLLLINYLTLTPAVMPAKAGIQWFMQAIPVQAGMTITGMVIQRAIP